MKQVFFTGDMSFAGFHEHEFQNETNRIIARISLIVDRYPELLKYLDELPEPTVTQRSKSIQLKDLTDYYNTLLELSRKYRS